MTTITLLWLKDMAWMSLLSFSFILLWNDRFMIIKEATACQQMTIEYDRLSFIHQPTTTRILPKRNYGDVLSFSSSSALYSPSTLTSSNTPRLTTTTSISVSPYDDDTAKLSSTPTSSSSSSSNPNSIDVRKQWLEKASKLRQEVELFENDPNRRKVLLGNINAIEKDIIVTDIADSVWTIRYRLSTTTTTDDEILQKTSASSSSTLPKYYAGQFNIQLSSNGYTQLLSTTTTNTMNDTKSSSSSPSLNIVKAWGWDIERSNDDPNDYLMFSIDVMVPVSTTGEVQQKRFYFQLKQNIDSNTKSINFEDGAITIKEDVVDVRKKEQNNNNNNGGLNRFFSSLFLPPRGILAQFQLVGYFIMKPTKSLSSSVSDQ